MLTRVIIFDMDGTLLDTENLAVKCWMEASEKMGMCIPREFFISVRGLNINVIWDKIRQYVSDASSFELLKNTKDHLFKNYIDEFGVPVKKGVLDILSELKKNKYIMAVGTSTLHERTDYYLKKTWLKEYFDAIVCGDDVVRSKPYPDIFLAISNKLGALPEECLVIEDSNYGITAAKSAGMRAIFVKDLISATKETIEYAILVTDNIMDIKKILKKDINRNIF